MAYAYYIMCNGKQIDCEELKGTYLIDDLNLNKVKYEVKSTYMTSDFDCIYDNSFF